MDNLKQYIGTKVVKADKQAMNMGEGIGFVPGYRVVYEDGYQSWSPADVFDAAYRRIDTGVMTFGLALEAMKQGKHVARGGWNGNGMWLALVDSIEYNVPKDEAFGLVKLPWIGMKTARGEFVPWLASQTDMLCEDWFIVKAAQVVAADEE